MSLASEPQEAEDGGYEEYSYVKPTRKLNRRSFLATVVGGAAASMAGGVAQASAAQVTDRDFGANADPSGQGRGNAGRSGITDRDPGDPAGSGRGLAINPQATTGSGAQSDSTNSGPSGTGPAGSTANPGATSGGRRHCSDADASPGDPSGRGRRC